jgi:sodium transport system permease protein
MVALMLVPTAAIFAAMLLSISVYAKSYKEAAGLISPLILLAILPICGPAARRRAELEMGHGAAHQCLAGHEGTGQGTMDYRMLSVILMSSTITAGLLLALCRWWFNREQVLFRN